VAWIEPSLRSVLPSSWAFAPRPARGFPC